MQNIRMADRDQEACRPRYRLSMLKVLTVNALFKQINDTSCQKVQYEITVKLLMLNYIRRHGHMPLPMAE